MTWDASDGASRLGGFLHVYKLVESCCPRDIETVLVQPELDLHVVLPGGVNDVRTCAESRTGHHVLKARSVCGGSPLRDRVAVVPRQ